MNRAIGAAVVAAGLLVFNTIGKQDPQPTEETLVSLQMPSVVCDCSESCGCCDACPGHVVNQATEAPAEITSVDEVSGLEVTGPTVVVLKADGCEPCERWWNQERPKWIPGGWAVRDVYGAKVRRYPTFRIFRRGRWYTHEGFMTIPQAKQLMGQ